MFKKWGTWLSDRIVSYYHKLSEVMGMPDYRTLFGGGFQLTIVPLVLRSFLLFRKLPYYSGKKIDLILYAKPYWNDRKDIQILDFKWELIRTKDNKLIDSDNGLLDRGVWAKKGHSLSGLISLPYLVGVGSEYILKIEVKLGEEIIKEWEEIFVFELHSNDELFTKIAIPVLTLLLGAFLFYIIQKLFGISL